MEIVVFIKEFARWHCKIDIICAKMAEDNSDNSAILDSTGEQEADGDIYEVEKIIDVSKKGVSWSNFQVLIINSPIDIPKLFLSYHIFYTQISQLS